MSCRIIVALAASLACGTLAHAADEKPAPAPPVAKKPVGPEAELREALKSLAKSMQEGNGDGIRSVIHAASPTERKMVDAMAAMAVEIAQLYKTAVKAFGEEQAKGLTGDLAAELTRIDDAEVTIDGDTATVRYAAHPTTTTATTKPAAAPAPATPAADDDDDPSPPPAAPLVLKRVAGRWQIPMSELSKDTTPEEIDQRLADLDVQTKVVAELSGEIAKGKYKSAEKAAEAWQAKMMQALSPPRKSAAAPAPQPEPPKDKPAAEKPK